MSALIFVYGTLKEGFPNFFRNPGQRVGGLYRTVQPYPFYVVKLHNEDRAPWLMNSPGQGHPVAGQVFEVDADTLQAMDVFEEVGLPCGYTRVELELEAQDEDGTLLRAHAYVKQDYQLVDCLECEGPFGEYTLDLARGYRLETA